LIQGVLVPTAQAGRFDGRVVAGQLAHGPGAFLGGDGHAGDDGHWGALGFDGDAGDLRGPFVLDDHLAGLEGKVGARPVTLHPFGVDGAEIHGPHLLPSQSLSVRRSLYPAPGMCGTMFAFTSGQKGGPEVPNTRSAEKRVRVIAKRTLDRKSTRLNSSHVKISYA